MTTISLSLVLVFACIIAQFIILQVVKISGISDSLSPLSDLELAFKRLPVSDVYRLDDNTMTCSGFLVS